MYKKIKPTIFPIHVYVMDFETAIKKGFEIFENDKGCLISAFDKSWCVVALNMKKFDTTTIVHECLHASLKVLRWSLAEISDENSETLCYLNDHIFREVSKIVEKEKKKEKE